MMPLMGFPESQKSSSLFCIFFTKFDFTSMGGSTSMRATNPQTYKYLSSLHQCKDKITARANWDWKPDIHNNTEFRCPGSS